MCNIHRIDPCPVCTDCDHWRWANAAGLGPICQDCGDEIEPPIGVREMTDEECMRNNSRNDRFLKLAKQMPRAAEPRHYRCTECRCRWRKNDDGTWSLLDAQQRPGACCDNSADFITKIEPVWCDCAFDAGAGRHFPGCPKVAPRDMRCPDCGKMMTNHVTVTRHETGPCDESFTGPPLAARGPSTAEDPQYRPACVCWKIGDACVCFLR